MSNTRNRARRSDRNRPAEALLSPSNATDSSFMQCSRCRCVVLQRESMATDTLDSSTRSNDSLPTLTPRPISLDDSSSSNFSFPSGSCNSCSSILPRLQPTYPFLTSQIEPPVPSPEATARSVAAVPPESPPCVAILLGVYTMRLLRVSLGDPLVLVHSDTSQSAVLPAWPSARLSPLRARLHVPPDVPGLSSLFASRLTSFPFVHIVPYALLPTAHDAAPPETHFIRCALTTLQSYIQMDHILESFIHNFLIGTYVFDGIRFTGKYYGQDITISVHPSPPNETPSIPLLPIENAEGQIDPLIETENLHEFVNHATRQAEPRDLDLGTGHMIPSSETNTSNLDSSMQNLSLSEAPTYRPFDESTHLDAVGSVGLQRRSPSLPMALVSLVPAAVFRVTPSTRVELETTPANPTRGPARSRRAEAPVLVVGLERERARLKSLLLAAMGLSCAAQADTGNYLTLPSASAKLPLVPRGALLVGPAGCGKTLLVDWLLSQCVMSYSRISASTSSEKPVTQLERALNKLLRNACLSGDLASNDTLREPHEGHIVVVEDLETLCPASARRADRTSAADPDALRVFSLLERLFACIERYPSCRMLVIGITRRPDLVDPDLRRAGHFETEIEINVPSQTLRSQLLDHFWESMRLRVDETDCPAESNVLPETGASIASMSSRIVASRTHAFTPADLLTLSRNAVMCHLMRSRQAGSSGGSGAAGQEEQAAQQSTGVSSPVVGGGSEGGEQLRIGVSAFFSALREQQPSALREVVLDLPEWSRVRWTDVGGMRELKFRLQQLVDWPRRYPERFRRFGIKPPRGLLLFGPPGCSKTLIARALATESQLNFISIKGPEVFNKYVGESERAVREIFRKARSAAPCIVFFDEIDAIAVARRSGSGGAGGGGSEGGSGGSGSSGVGERILAQLLTEMDGVEQLADVLVLAATNRPDLIDRALLRPGRFDALVYVPLPDHDTRREIFRVHMRNTPLAPDVDMERLADLTDKYSGAEIAAVIRHASYEALSEELDAHSGYEQREQQADEQRVNMHHLQNAVQQVPPRTPESNIQHLEDFARRYSSFASELITRPQSSST